VPQPKSWAHYTLKQTENTGTKLKLATAASTRAPAVTIATAEEIADFAED
jgi:hypothetical protein